jgi:hypothetical protein
MKTSGKILIGGAIGMAIMSFISSTYFYNFIRKVVRGLRENLKDYNY